MRQDGSVRASESHSSTKPSDAVSDGLHRRPRLTHLNADSSWLLQLPIPSSSPISTGGPYFNILVDPWFRGHHIDIPSWFSTQWHAVESSVGSIDDVDALIRRDTGRAQGGDEASKDGVQTPPASKPCIDLVVISHEFTDHCHRETLLEMDPGVPVVATKKAASLVQSWEHFANVHTIPQVDAGGIDWTQTCCGALPDWLGVGRVASSLFDLSGVNSALLLSFDVGDGAESIIYSPHGIPAQALDGLARAHPPLRVLALMHGLHEVSLGWVAPLNLGAHNGLRLQRSTRARYWVQTHDEVTTGRGFIGAILRRNALTIEDALEKERAEGEALVEDGRPGGEPDCRFHRLGNGERLILA